jgi:hypothetical protein
LAPETVTAVPGKPDVGFKKNVGASATVTVNGAVFVSLGTFVVIITV